MRQIFKEQIFQKIQTELQMPKTFVLFQADAQIFATILSDQIASQQ